MAFVRHARGIVRKFVERALAKAGRMDPEQLKSLLFSMAAENERLETVLESMTDGVVVCDSAHNIVLCNKSSERLLPLLGIDILEKPLWSVIDDEEIAKFFRISLEDDDKVADREFGVETKGGFRIVSISIMPLVSERRIQGNIVHVEDITEKRNRENRLRRAESLASLTTLAAGVAHEIKNPLGSIGIRMQLIKKTLVACEETDKGTISRHIDVVNEEIERLNRIVVDFLFAVRPMNLSLESVSVNAVAKDTFEFMKYELDDAGIESRMELASDPLETSADPRFLKQAILNLMKNAREAMTEGGKLVLTTSRRDDSAIITIADTGTGIDEENLSKIFEPYFTTKDSGSGLGLTLVFKIVKEHGGEISVRSRMGEGTVFTVALPLPPTKPRLLSQATDGTQGGLS